MSVHRVTADEARALVGKWFTSGEDAVILIRVTGSSALVRYAGNRGRKHQSSHYAWTSVDALVRREDMDNHPLPDWLQQALDSPRPPRDLHDVIQALKNPAYTRHALEQQALSAQAARMLEQLQYVSYAQARGRNLDKPLEYFRPVFGDDVEQLEARYIREGAPAPRTWTIDAEGGVR